jgi:hypothetical protein
MMPPLFKSIALATILISSSPTGSSLAFTATTPPRRGHGSSSSSLCRRRDGNFHPPSLRAASSSSEEDNGGPSSSSSSSSVSSSSSLTSSQEQGDRLGEMIDLPREDPQQGRGRTGPSSSCVDPLAGEEPRSSEFRDLEPPPPPSLRRLARLESERATASAYVAPGTDAYWDLRDEISRLEGDVRAAIEAGVSDVAVAVIRGMLEDARSRDPEHVYAVASERARVAERMGRMHASEGYGEEGRRARRMLPQFNLEGLWVGK